MRSCSRVKLVLQVHTVEHFKDVKLINATQMRTSIACCAATMLLLLPVILMLQGCHLGAYHLSFGPWTFVEILGHLCHPLWANAESFWFFLMFDIFVYICLLYIYISFYLPNSKSTAICSAQGDVGDSVDDGEVGHERRPLSSWWVWISGHGGSWNGIIFWNGLQKSTSSFGNIGMRRWWCWGDELTGAGDEHNVMHCWEMWNRGVCRGRLWPAPHNWPEIGEVRSVTFSFQRSRRSHENCGAATVG